MNVTLALEGGGKWVHILGVHWPASLAEMVNSSSVRDLSQGNKVASDRRHLTSTTGPLMEVHMYIPYTYTYSYMHIPKQNKMVERERKTPDIHFQLPPMSSWVSKPAHTCICHTYTQKLL